MYGLLYNYYATCFEPNKISKLINIETEWVSMYLSQRPNIDNDTIKYKCTKSVIILMEIEKDSTAHRFNNKFKCIAFCPRAKTNQRIGSVSCFYCLFNWIFWHGCRFRLFPYSPSLFIPIYFVLILIGQQKVLLGVCLACPATATFWTLDTIRFLFFLFFFFLEYITKMKLMNRPIQCGVFS